jgi:hypothetical protein
MQNDQFFSVAHTLNVNVEPLPAASSAPTASDFEQEIPTPFKLASENAVMSPGLHRALSSLGEAGKELGHYLKSQSDKLDMVLSYVLSMQDDPNYRTQTSHFGGSYLTFLWPTELHRSQLVRIKLFIPEESAAIYCYAEVTRCQAIDHGYQVECHYKLIREQDREVLVRASLHVQSKQLQKRAESRRQSESN